MGGSQSTGKSFCDHENTDIKGIYIKHHFESKEGENNEMLYRPKGFDGEYKSLSSFNLSDNEPICLNDSDILSGDPDIENVRIYHKPSNKLLNFNEWAIKNKDKILDKPSQGKTGPRGPRGPTGLFDPTIVYEKIEAQKLISNGVSLNDVNTLVIFRKL